MTPSEQFAAMYRSGAQGCEMDWGAAQALAQDIDRLRAENERLWAALVKLAKSYRADASRLLHSDLQRIEIIDAALARQTEGER